MRIRYSQTIDIRFNYPQNLLPTIVIPPLVMIVFVENAFKHGISRKQDSYIYIDVSVDEQNVVVRFTNSLFEDEQRDKQGGVGLENVSRRLEYIYGDKYSLDIDKQSNCYCVTLKLPINHEY
jgi:LytS/YehU family sensor histidine kinase